MSVWTRICVDLFPATEINGRRLLIGDTTKVSKEAQRMPGVKTLRQESENSGKPEYIRGHHFGFVSLLVGSLEKALAVPLQGELHEGVEQIRPGVSFAGKPATLVTRMAHLAMEMAKQVGYLCHVVLDAYYSVGPVFKILKSAVTEKGQLWLHVIVRAEENYVAYMLYQEAPKKKVDERKKVILSQIFDFPQLFTEDELTLYGETKTVRYCCENFLWMPISDVIRFVCVIDGEGRYILMSSDLDLPATEIISIYSYRFKIEGMFMALKHLLGVFCYHFWTMGLPKPGKCVSVPRTTHWSRPRPSHLQASPWWRSALPRLFRLTEPKADSRPGSSCVGGLGAWHSCGSMRLTKMAPPRFLLDRTQTGGFHSRRETR